MSHPASELLLSFASGRADLTHRVILEAHLAGCPDCRATVAELAAPGAALLRSFPDAPPPPALWERLRDRIAEPAGQLQATAPELAGLPLPPAAVAELPPSHQRRPLRWHWGLARGARLAVLSRDPSTHSILLVGHIPPRRSFPRHQHLGPEDVLVLAGAYADAMGHYAAGEYATYAPGTVHQPVIDAGETCWVLTRLEQPNRFFGWMGWVQRHFTRPTFFDGEEQRTASA